MATDPKFTISAEDRFSGTFTKLKRDIAASKGSLEGLAGVAGSVNAALGRIAFGSVVGAAGFAAGVLQIARGLDDLNDASASTGATVERLSALDRVARENGGNLETVSGALLRLNTVLREAKPDSPGAKALEAIGLSAKQLRDLDPADALKAVADALARYADDGNKARIIQELFGKSTKDVADFLRDLSQKGTLNATVTAKQAEEAEKFNKQLYQMQANATDAGRALVSDLLPGLNAFFLKLKEIKDQGGAKGFFSSIFEQFKANLTSDRLRSVVDDIEGVQNALKSNPGDGYLVKRLAALREEAAKLTKEAAASSQRLKDFAGQPVVDESGIDSEIERLRMKRPSVRTPDDKGPKGSSEAERLLDSLQKQIEAQAELTEVEKVRLAIERGLQGSEADKRKAIAAAEFLTALKEVNKEQEKEKGLQDLIAKKRQEDLTSVQRLLESTPTGQRQKLVLQADLVLDFARRNSGDDQIQKQAKEALEKLNAEMRKIGDAAEAPQSQFEKLADTIEKTMERSTDAVLDFVVEGKGGMGSLVKAFARDILRQQIESPIRDTFKGVADVIRKSLQGLGSGDFLSGIADFFKKLFGGGGGGGILGALGGLFGGSSRESVGFTGRASGGAVKAGQLVRWQENGREWFIPQTDGTVVKGSQATAGGNTFAPVINVNGDVGPQTVALIQAMVAKQQAQWMRSMRTGGAMSPV